MKKIEKISIVGLGAVGSAYAGQMLRFLPRENIRVIADGARYVNYRNEGININGSTIKFDIYAPEEKCSPADLLIFAVKFNQLEEAIQLARHHVGDDTIIISLLNGITSEEIIGNVFGREKILYSLCFGIDSVRTGNRVSFKNLGTIAFGEKNNHPGDYSAKVKKLQEFFTRVQINFSVPEDMMRTLWWKFLLNVGINQVSAVLRAPYGVFQNVPAAREIMLGAMEEVISISTAAGVNLGQDDIQELLGVIDGLSPAGKTSMLQDIEARRQTEVNIFGGTVVELGRKYGISTPINQILLDIIRAQEKIFIYLPDCQDGNRS